MKLNISLFFLGTILSFTALKAQEACADSSSFYIYHGEYMPQLVIIHNGKASYHSLQEDMKGEEMKFECELRQLNDRGPKELILKWSIAIYGSGGGMNYAGLSIWDLEADSLLFKANTYCSEESFGRHGGERFLHSCEIPIEFLENGIKINKRECQGFELETLEDLQDYCLLKDLKPGIISFR